MRPAGYHANHVLRVPADRSRTTNVGVIAAGASDALLADLDEAQREAVLVTSGPLCILAGAGTGKTRAISRRVGYALATGAVAPSHVLVVTFTEKAAREMRERLAALGRPGVTASTFHAAALRQLRHFWPRRSGRELPGILESKVGLVVELARALPGGYRYVAARDLAGEIEWAKARRIRPAAYEEMTDAQGHDGPLPARLFAPLYGRYEEAKERVGRIDFEDMLEMIVRLIEDDPDAAAEIRDRYRWFSVDEYQDTNALQQALLDAWLGGREDLAVVGDEDQTIYTFTGASSEWLTGFTGRYPGARVVRLEANYRSTPQILTVANRLLGSGPRLADGPPKRLRATRPDGPPPTILQFPTGADEESAIAADARRLIGSGVCAESIAVLVRTNGQLVGVEAAFRAAGIPFQLRGERFFERPEIRRAIGAARSIRHAAAEPRPEATGAGASAPAGAGPGAPTAGSAGARSAEGESTGLAARLAVAWAKALDFRPDDVPAAEEARQRHGALLALLEVGRELEEADPAADIDDFLAEVDRRATAEADGAAGIGVELLTYHRSKGLEWDAVFLPALEEGLLPIRQASEPAEIDEERRLLYVGITRARRHLWLSSARHRDGKATERRRSRFLLELIPTGVRPAPRHGSARSAAGPGSALGSGSETDPSARATGSGSERAPAADGRSAASSTTAVAAADAALAAGASLFDALRAWRVEVARGNGLPPYVVFHDSTLIAIAERQPRSLADLAGITGIGPTKLDRYGADIVGIVVRGG
jgi:DNA helicase-2/ATP-dependent DNA helicase PcrA